MKLIRSLKSCQLGEDFTKYLFKFPGYWYNCISCPVLITKAWPLMYIGSVQPEKENQVNLGPWLFNITNQVKKTLQTPFQMADVFADIWFFEKSTLCKWKAQWPLSSSGANNQKKKKQKTITMGLGKEFIFAQKKIVGFKPHHLSISLFHYHI